jgi:hypothetical protein
MDLVLKHRETIIDLAHELLARGLSGDQISALMGSAP